MIPGLERFPGRGHSNPLQYSCLENLLERGTWQATVHRVAQSWTQLKQLSRHARSHRVKAAQSCPTHCDPIPGHGILQARILEWVPVPFSDGIFPTQGWNPGLPHCRWIIYQVIHKGSPRSHFSSVQFSHSVQFSSVAQSCPTLCDPMNRSMPGLPVHHHLLEFTQTHVHRVGDAIQPSHPLSSPFPLAPNPSQHQSLFQ